MVRKLTKLRIDEISSVDKGAGDGCRIVLMKRDGAAQSFNDIMNAKADITADDISADASTKLLPKLNDMIAAMIRADPTQTEEQHLHTLLHTAHGRQVAEHLNNLSKGNPPMEVDISKLLEISAAGLNAQVTRRDGETFAKAFSRKLETDSDYARQWQALTDVKLSFAVTNKAMASLEPTSTSGSNFGVDDPSGAVRLLTEMAEKQHRTFEQVFSDPANAELATRTYTAAHRNRTSTIVS